MSQLASALRHDEAALRDEFHDAASEISSLTATSSEDAATEPTSVRGDADAAADLRLEAEAEDECGELYSRPFPARSTKRFSSLSMASSIAAIMPFISAPEAKLPLGYAAPAERERPGKASLPHDLNRPLPAYNRRRLRGSAPQLALLLQKAAANAQSEPAASFSAQAVDEWATSLAESFDKDGLSTQITLQYPSAAAAVTEAAPAPATARPAKPHDTPAKWRLRPLSTWGRKSVQPAAAAPAARAAPAAAAADAVPAERSDSPLLVNGSSSSRRSSSVSPLSEPGAAPEAAQRTSRVPAAWTGSRRGRRASQRQSRFWQLVWPASDAAGDAAGDAAATEPMLRPLSEVSEVSEEALEPAPGRARSGGEQRNEQRNEQGSEQRDDAAQTRGPHEPRPLAEKRQPRERGSPHEAGERLRKRSRLRKLWQSLVPSSAFTGTRLT